MFSYDSLLYLFDWKFFTKFSWRTEAGLLSLLKFKICGTLMWPSPVICTAITVVQPFISGTHQCNNRVVLQNPAQFAGSRSFQVHTSIEDCMRQLDKLFWASSRNSCTYLIITKYFMLFVVCRKPEYFILTFCRIFNNRLYKRGFPVQTHYSHSCVFHQK